MFDELIKRINSVFNINLDGVKPVFSEKDYQGLLISKDNFHRISVLTPKRKVVFVDGGNVELFNNSSLSIQKIRVYACVFDNDKKVFSRRKDFFMLALSDFKDESIFYNVSLFPNVFSFTVDSSDPLLKQGVARVSISRMGDLVRRFLELWFAAELTNEFKDSIFVLDGTLKPFFPNEVDFLNRLFDSALRNNVLISALAKTSTIMTNKNLPLSFVLNKLSSSVDFKSWFYHPIVLNKNEDHKAEIFFVKLNDSSRYVFRFEIFNKQLSCAEEVISTLAFYSSDVSFPGYPYGLIDADRFARISKDESSVLRLRLLSLLSRSVRESESSLNAHDVLDRMIRFK